MWWFEKNHKARLGEHHDLFQEFEANGRRYYVVFVICDWRDHLDEINLNDLDPNLTWSDAAFPGGEELWPEGIRDLVRFSSSLGTRFLRDCFCEYVMSWEPI
jgi:hypothetical protein